MLMFVLELAITLIAAFRGWRPVCFNSLVEDNLMDFAIRRHHLIEEAKSELDIAYEEVKRVEQEVMAYEALYNEKSKKLNGNEADLLALMAEKEEKQENLGIDELYKLQRAAIQRFAQISSVFTIVHSVDSISIAVDLIRQILFRADDAKKCRAKIDQTLRRFCCSLRAYTVEESSIENDHNVRESWGEIEAMLKEIGRASKTRIC